ncbi:hypothetical protein Xcel_2048 [Xylanimonas cellulosilytica DSM 15894]|uniref:SPOR domain-containing protein n=1 Tax=Xylanimonas cellulosilytica (strain DSM 15894 / JCM 12276 / CECT 5975 / KCTC 9989 / LMG 20990 / NBRC 107835 / XIL07) TaxID=446471 RepID=D1BTT8_XYLCX|nr:hypothetical protein [Xylanimonas cellulosilytica]ACZ31067.1 hypothetical protein Xcel_2048 [Xylanimonas cellulosilytica DSM 15894]
MSEESGATETARYWFNTRTGQVEHGRQSPWNELMGPYGTAEEAARALDKARDRTESWDDEDAAWRDTGPDDDGR